MEILRNIIRQFYHVPLLVLSLLFVIQVFFQGGIEGERDVFTAAAKVFDSMMEGEVLLCDGLTYLENEGSNEVPEIMYTSGAQQAGTNFMFKSLLRVKKANGVIVSGEVEDDFAIYLMDIKTLEGESVLETLSTVEIENLGEIPAPFIYDKATDQLYLYSGGVYLVQVKIYANCGGQAVYEFQMPVETM